MCHMDAQNMFHQLIGIELHFHAAIKIFRIHIRMNLMALRLRTLFPSGKSLFSTGHGDSVARVRSIFFHVEQKIMLNADNTKKRDALTGHELSNELTVPNGSVCRAYLADTSQIWNKCNNDATLHRVYNLVSCVTKAVDQNTMLMTTHRRKQHF